MPLLIVIFGIVLLFLLIAKFKLNAFIQNVKDTMDKDGFKEDDFEIIGRVKHYYSIYLKSN